MLGFSGEQNPTSKPPDTHATWERAGQEMAEREESPIRKRLKPENPDKAATAGMQRYLVTVEYIGSRYMGFQKQKGQDSRTVQGALEEAFSKFVGKSVESAPSSRTDAGVHALRNVCHVDVERVSKRKPGEILPPHEPTVVKRAVNHFLQKNGEDVQVVEVQCVPHNFHARFEAKERTYHYRIIVSCETLSVFERNRAWHVLEELNVEAMKEACDFLVGHHDFSSFRAAGCQAKSPIKTLDELRVSEMPSWSCYLSQAVQKLNYDESFIEMYREKVCSSDVRYQNFDTSLTTQKDPLGMSHKKPLQSRCYVVMARARSFLYHQVRLMVGLLKAVGTGEVQISDVPHLLEARTVTKVPPMAPACGLYLTDVKYELD